MHHLASRLAIYCAHNSRGSSAALIHHSSIQVDKQPPSKALASATLFIYEGLKNKEASSPPPGGPHEVPDDAAFYLFLTPSTSGEAFRTAPSPANSLSMAAPRQRHTLSKVVNMVALYSRCTGH